MGYFEKRVRTCASTACVVALVWVSTGPALADGPRAAVSGAVSGRGVFCGKAAMNVRRVALARDTADGLGLQPGDGLRITIYGRKDLPEKYTVDSAGEVSVPTIGRFSAAGQPGGALEDAIRGALQKLMNRSGYVSVEVIKRRPVFVMGYVAKPGSYDYELEMSVIHAIVLAGGTLNSERSANVPIEALREATRVRATKAELMPLLAHRAHLEAQRLGKTEVDVPKALAARAGVAEAARLIAIEQRIGDRKRTVLQTQRDQILSTIKEIKIELRAFEKEFESIGQQRALREKAVATVSGLSKRGLTTQQRQTDAEILLASIDRDAQGAIANIARSRRSLGLNEHALRLLELEVKAATAKRLQEVEARIAVLDATLRGTRATLRHLAGLQGQLLAEDGDVSITYEILRRDATGRLVAQAAEQGTALRPGDVVRVRGRRGG